MTLLEMLYFTITAAVAGFVAQWVYVREGRLIAIVAFVVTWGPWVWFFFAGWFGRLLDCFRKPPKS
jgi:hypothetical protein